MNINVTDENNGLPADEDGDRLASDVAPVSLDSSDNQNQFHKEAHNLIRASGQTPSENDLKQILKAVQILCGTALYSAGGGTANAQTATLSPVPAAYTVGMIVRVKAGATNTGATTLNVNGLGAKDVKKHGSATLEANDIVSGEIYTFIYDGTNFQLMERSTAPGFSHLQTFTANGNFTVPAGVYRVLVKVWGDAGAGGIANVGGFGGAGGGGGSYSESILNVTPGDVIPVVVGQGGIYGGASPTGSSFGGTTVTAPGGNNAGTYTQPGAGGVVGTGNLTIAGQTGFLTQSVYAGQPGGGSPQGGFGGMHVIGTNATGNNGTAPGGAGGGGAQPTGSGGNGARGQVNVYF